jgi:hypothetical protein
MPGPYTLRYQMQLGDGSQERNILEGTIEEMNIAMSDVISRRGNNGVIETMSITKTEPNAGEINEAFHNGWKDESLGFATWKQEVHRACRNISGVSLDEIPDWDFASAYECFASAYECGTTPEDAAYAVLEAAGFPFED